MSECIISRLGYILVSLFDLGIIPLVHENWVTGLRLMPFLFQGTCTSHSKVFFLSKITTRMIHRLSGKFLDKNSLR